MPGRPRWNLASTHLASTNRVPVTAPVPTLPLRKRGAFSARRNSISRAPATRLLAQRRGDVVVGAAIVGLARAARDQHLRRALFRRIHREALAFLVALVLA
jgi:hypothetical protein